MTKKPAKRKYRNSLDFVESGFRACWRNAQDLVLASQKLLDNNLYGPALSLSVLALEELGKLVAIDGLLYARPDDNKATTFAKSVRDHSTKLTLLESFPLLLDNLSRMDPRYGEESRYHKALVISGLYLKEDGNAVMAELREAGFVGLDSWKQQGLHVCLGDKGFIAPCNAVNPSLAKAVHRLAWRATTTLDFHLKRGNLERYIENARSIRAALTEEQHEELERLGKELFTKIFASASDEAESLTDGGLPPAPGNFS